MKMGDGVTNPPDGPIPIQHTTIADFFEAMSQVSCFFTELFTITSPDFNDYHVVTRLRDGSGPVYRWRMVDGTQRDIVSHIRNSQEFTFRPPEFENLLAVGFASRGYIELTIKHGGPQMYVVAVNYRVDPI